MTDSGHPTVGFIQSPAGLCTGTLIGRRSVLTAAHCFSVNGSTSATFRLGGQNYSGRARWHDAYAGGIDNDIAIMTLDRSVSGVTPSSVKLDGNWYAQTQSATSVGAGEQCSWNYVQHVDPNPACVYRSLGIGGTKRRVYLPSLTMYPILSASAFEWYETGSVSGHTCAGDSGGPLFDNSDACVVAVHGDSGFIESGAEGFCGGRNVEIRTDYFWSFIAREVQAAGATPIYNPSTGCASFNSSSSEVDTAGIVAVLMAVALDP